MATLKEIYEAFKADGAPLPDTYEAFESYMNHGYEHRKQWYDAFKADGAPLPDTYEEFSKALFEPAVHQNPAVAPTLPPASPKDTQYFKLRRGGKDFTVSTDEINAAGGLTGWAKANPGAPLRVYMQGTNEDGKPFDGHVDLSVAHDRSKRRGYKYTTTNEAIEDKPWQPTEQQKIAMSGQLHQMQEQTDAMFAESRERMENVSEYYRGNRGLGFHTVEGKPVFNPETGKMEKTYLTPTGDRTTSKTAADMSTYNFRQAMAAADMSVGAQIRRAEAELAELHKQLNESSSRVHKEWAEEYEKNDAPLAAVLAANTYVPRQTADKENSALRVAIHQREEQLKNLYEERDRQKGQDVGFWRGFGRIVGDVRTWDFGMSDLSDAMTLMNADQYSLSNTTEGEKRAGQKMLSAVYDAQQTEQMFGENASFWNRAGVMTGYMPSFMLDFALTGGGFDAINVGGKMATRGAAKLLSKDAIEEMTKLGIKEYAKKYGVRGVGRMAENWTIKALGTTADELLIRAPLMTNTIQGGKTTADIIDRKLGDVVIDENGNYDFSNDKSWGSAVWQGEANSIIENFSEMFGTHLDGVVPALAKTFGGKRISGMLARANASNYGQILATTRKQFERLGVSDYFGEVSEEYYGQLWRSMLNLDDAYTNVPVLDKDGNQVLDAEGKPVYERKNLLFTGQFHGDIWGGMALSMGLMGAGKYSISGIAYGNMKHQVNKVDKRAAEIFTPERWEPIRELIDNTTNEDMGALAENMMNDQNLSDDEFSAVVEYMERSLNLRGLNLGAMAQSRGAAQGDEAPSANIEVDSELTQSYIDGYEASSPQEMNDAQNMYEFQRKRVEDMFQPDMLDWFDGDPVTALMDMSQNGLFSQDEIDAARDYINAKTVRDGILQRVNDNIDEQIAQSEAMINARINRASGMIQPILIGGRQGYVAGGLLSVNPDGTIDRNASDEIIVVRDAQTGKLEFIDSKSIVSALEEIDPEMEKALAVDNIRMQAVQAAANAMNGTLTFNPGDVVQINDGGGLTQITILGPVVDNESGMPIEGQVMVQFANGQQMAFAKGQLQAFADAANLERLNSFEQARAASRAQQQATAAEALRPQFALNDEFTILNDAGTPIRGSITRGKDEDGKIEIYTEEPVINGKQMNHITPEELEHILDTYNGEPIATTVTAPEIAENVPKPTENPEIDAVSSETPTVTVHKTEERATEPQQSALSRIPVDEQGQPKYDEADPETAWDAIVEQAQGDEAIAAEVVADIVSDREEDFNAAEKAYNKTKEGKPEKRKKDDPAPTMAERIAAKNAAKEALAEAQAIRDRAKAALDHWKKIAGTMQRRENERRNAEEAEARLKAEREEAERIEREALNGVPDWSVDTPQDARARGYRRNGPQKVDRPEIIDNHAIGNSVEVKFGDDVMPTGNIVVVEASQLQPSHRDGQRNPAHFLDEAQPKERNDAASRLAASKIAENIRPEEITSSVTAYTGAPSINSRGEVIQGNNRSEALRIMYERFSQSAERYKQYLIDHAAEFGLTPEAIAAFNQPVLANMLDVSDEDAIALGQYVAQDTESGGIERIKTKNVVQRMGDKIRNFANILLRSADDEATFAQLVDANGVEVLRWMNQRGFISNTQYVSAFDSNGNLSAEAVNDLKGIMYQSIFTGGSTRLEEMFNKMPAKAQRAILATAFRDYDSPLADRMINEIQQSIIAYNALMGYEQFRDATNAEAIMLAVEAWKIQSAFDDVTGEPYLPSETFSCFALALAAMYKGQTQRHIQSVFNMMYDIVQGTEQDNLFEIADKTPKPLAEAIRRVLNLEYQPIVKPTTDNGTNGNAILDVNSEDGQDGRPGSNGNADGAEQSQEEAEPSDSGTGTASDSGQGGEIATEYTTKAPVAFDYYTDGLGVVRSTEFFLMAVAGAFPRAMSAIEAIANKYRSAIIESANPSEFVESKIGSAIHKEIRAAVQQAYNGNNKVPNMVSYMFNNPTGIFPSEAQSFQMHLDQLEDSLEQHEFDDLDNSEIEKRIEVSDDDLADGDSKNPSYKRTITIDGKHKVIQVDEPNSDGFYIGSYFEFNGRRFGDLTEVIDHIDKQAKLAADIASASAEVNTEPTPAQKEAGNYRKGHVQVGIFDVTIEQPVGSVRRGTDADGKEWETTMQNTYGYIRGTEGVDGDHIDVFLSTDIDDWIGRRVVIVDQYNPDGTFDEHKVMLGFNDKADAINAYLANYEKGWEKGRRLVFSTATLEDFEKWIESSHRKQKPYHEYRIADKAEVDESTPENPVSATIYTIDTYTTKKNKTYHRVIFPRADKEVWQERLNLAKKMGGTSVPKGYGFKTREEAKAFAKAVADPTAVADAQPLSLEDMRASIIEEPTNIISSTEAEQSSETATQPEIDTPVNPSGNKLVTDERYAKLRERMRKKLGGQLNMGVDPEILAIGTEMAVYHIEKGARKFKAYASAMIADLGDAIRPYLKSFYNAVRDMPEAEAAGLVADMDSYDEVRSVDIANFDKPGTDAMATAAAIVKEQDVEKEKEEAEAKIKKARKREISKSEPIPTTDSGLFDTVEDDTAPAPAITVPEQRPAADLLGDSAAFQEREAQTVELSQLTDTEILGRQGDGYGAYSDAEMSYMNGPVSKAMGKNRFSKKRQAEFAARERQRMVARIKELADRMHLDNVEILTDASQLEGKRATAKGFYNKRTGKITIVIPNNVSTIDAEQTLLHEAVAHHGLRQLFGKQFETFLDNVYQSADESIRRKIDEMAAKNGWDPRTATEEYLAGLAEDMEFENAREHAGWWNTIKRLFLDMLEKIGFEGFRDKVGVVLTDNELRYILWRSYENLAEPGKFRSILGEAADVAKQSELKVGNYAPTAADVAMAAEMTASELTNDIFNEQLERYLSGKMPSQEIIRLGNPQGVMRHFLPKLPIIMRQRVIRKGSEKKHDVAVEALHDMPGNLSSPIFVFQRNDSTIGVLTDMKDRKGKNVCVAIELSRQIQDGKEYLEVNDVRSFHGREFKNIIGPIVNNNTLRWVDKKKGLTYLSSASQQVRQEIDTQALEDAAKIVKSFENPTIEEEDNLLFRGTDGSARAEYDRRVRIQKVEKKRGRAKTTNRAAQLNEAYLDSMRSLRVLQEAISHESGKQIEDFEDAYVAENHMSSRNEISKEVYTRDFFEPMCKEVAKVCGAKEEAYQELLDYIIAKHGLERNAYMRSKAVNEGIDQTEADSTDYSGLTALTNESNVADAETAAERLVNGYEASHATAELWRRINAATRETLRTRYQGGLLSKEVYEQILGQYQYYIPLKGWSETTAADIYEYAVGGYGLGSALMTAYGRKSVADDPLATIMTDAQRTIMEANRNIMKQKLLNLALNHETNLLTISKQWYVKQPDGTWCPDNPVIPEDADGDIVDAIVKQHEARMIALKNNAKTIRKGLQLGLISKDADTTQHVVKVKRNGETFCIYVNGDPRAARAINGMLNPDSGQKSRMAKVAQNVKDFMSKAFTTWNPEFVVGNLSRDVMFAGVAVAVKEDGKYARDYTGNITSILIKASLPRLMYKWEHGTLDETNETERYFKEFLMNGGETGFTQLNTVEKAKRDMQRFLREAQGGMSSLPKKAWRGFWNGVEFMNRSAEDTTRFAVFMTSRQQGRSVSRSIHDAKEITVNFNKKGSGAWGARTLNFLYVFFNAAMQAVANAGRLVYHNPGKATTAMGIFMASGFVLPMISSVLAGLCGDGDDDDYWNLSEWVRRNNLVIYIPFTKKYMTIPIAHELRPFYGIGEIAYSVMCGKETAEDGLWKAVEGFSGLLPIDYTGNGGNLKANFSPTIAQPIVQVDENIDYFGKPIYKKTPWNTAEPEWTKAYKGTSGLLVDVSRILSEAGSTTDEYGVVSYPTHWYSGDINPAVVEHLLESYTGGLGKTVNGIGKTISMLWNEDARELRNAPVVRKLIQSSDEKAEERRFSNDYFNLRTEYEESKAYLRKLGNLDEDGIFGVANRVDRWLDTDAGRRHILLDEYFRELRRYQRELDSEDSDSIRSLIQHDIDSVKHELVHKIDSINAGLKTQQ